MYRYKIPSTSFIPVSSYLSQDPILIWNVIVRKSLFVLLCFLEQKKQRNFINSIPVRHQATAIRHFLARFTSAFEKMRNHGCYFLLFVFWCLSSKLLHIFRYFFIWENPNYSLCIISKETYFQLFINSAIIYQQRIIKTYFNLISN